ncbi:MAG: hypothetical protein AAF849_20610 [Bacteroidota bacterium]
MLIKIPISILFCAIVFLSAGAQCKYLDATTIRRLAKSSYSSKMDRLHQKGAEQAIVNKINDCQFNTFVACQNYIGDEKWHWAEIISFNSCDKILTYSTSNQAHFSNIKSTLTKSYKSIGHRTYDQLAFEVYQDKKGSVIEINKHSNEEGIMFYLINIMKTRTLERKK